ncbi:hypothetical protein C8J48_2053 [Desmospora activa DSM 45169]|uniref:Uncharacterized protein n=1 Tax=Desmospora activa DSM 45169 TaxID=1121389 RepID=A0A2T4ZC34_9BACL|nr:hypothetical protein C8J48_2053 [Desmospora activa DSM 45169]
MGKPNVGLWIVLLLTVVVIGGLTLSFLSS